MMTKVEMNPTNVNKLHISTVSLLKHRLLSGVLANVFVQPIILLASLAGSIVVARTLGPELFAVIATISATATTAVAFGDMGLSRSIPKIIPDVAVKFGNSTALQVQRKLTIIKIITVCASLFVLFILYINGISLTSSTLMVQSWFYLFVLAKAIIGTVIVIQQGAVLSAFRNKELAFINLLITILDPLFSITIVISFRNPYAVVGGSIFVDIIQLILLRKFMSYDLDKEKQTSISISWIWILKQYWQYMGITYLLFLFNRFVYGLPLTLFFITKLGANAFIIGNTSLAVSIVQRGWDIANMPLMNLRAPLLARLHAENDVQGFIKIQRLMVAIVILTSGILAVVVVTLGPFVLNLLYGSHYINGVKWGINICVIGLVANFFALGNSTLHQTNRFLPEILGLITSGLFIALNYFCILNIIEPTYYPLVILLGFVVGRAIFWVITDLWADCKIFHWQGFGVKLRGLFSITVVLAILVFINSNGYNASKRFLSALIGLLSYLFLFRVTGGVGQSTRKVIAGLLDRRLSWLSYVI
ncbi:MAG: hypothetical protein ABIL02_03130 [candidate division WOR-3 bacterium]